ncbi:MAG: PqqD family protein [Thermoleophilia bacterium]|nr:PqqD family protein [Thermoleophilia bacterium]
MADLVRGDVAYTPSEAVVAREIEGEIVIVPLTAGIGDLEDELYSLNETGKDVWRLLDGRTLDEVVGALTAEYDASREAIDRDVRGLLEELLRRDIVRAA